MLDRYVLEALQKAAIAAVAASTFPTLRVQPLGKTFDPGEGADPGKYLELVFIPNNGVGEVWGDGKTYRGIFRMVLHWPNSDEGAYPPIDVLASIASYFNKDARFTAGSVTVRPTTEPDLASPVPTGHETLYPVSIRYLYFQP